MSDYLIREIGSAPNVDVCYRVQVADGTGTGTGHLESLVLQDTASGARRSVPADALFVLIGSQPRTQWLGDSIARDQRGFILTGPDLPGGTSGRWPPGRPPLPLETSLPGVFAAGDVRHGSVNRVASAVGEGAAAIPLVHRYLQHHRGHTQPPRASNPLAGQHAPNQHAPCHPRHRMILKLSQRPGECAYAHRTQHDRQPTLRRPKVKQITTDVPAQKSSFHPRAAAATVTDVMRVPLTTISQGDHVAAAAYLMKHAGTTALMVVNAQTGQPPASSPRQTLPARSPAGKTSTTSGSMPR